jgi:hypothetical protein
VASVDDLLSGFFFNLEVDKFIICSHCLATVRALLLDLSIFFFFCCCSPFVVSNRSQGETEPFKIPFDDYVAAAVSTQRISWKFNCAFTLPPADGRQTIECTASAPAASVPLKELAPDVFQDLTILPDVQVRSSATPHTTLFLLFLLLPHPLFLLLLLLELY